MVGEVIPFRQLLSFVKELGTLSPLVHDVYTDDVSATLSDTTTRCHIQEQCIISLSYVMLMIWYCWQL